MQLLGGRDLGQIAVGLDAERGVADVGCGDKGGHQFFRSGGEKFAFVGRDKIEPRFHFEPRPQFFTFQLRDGLLQKLTVKIEPNGDDVAALGGAEDAARAANFEVAHRDPEARA